MDFEIINPRSKEELLKTVKLLSRSNFRYAAGCTDLLLDLKRKPVEDLTVINLKSVQDSGFNSIRKKNAETEIGAMATAHQLVINSNIKENFPVLHQAALNLASTQIRQVATVGGNICTASPSGDVACALVALKSMCGVLAVSGKIREIEIEKFFTGVRTTDLKKSELLYSVVLPTKNKKTKQIHSGFVKIGTRLSMECSVVSLSYHIQCDAKGFIVDAGVAIGASAPTIRFAKKACEYIQGKKMDALSDKERDEFANLVLSYASPISDIRATSWYRKEVLFNISKALFE